MLRSARLTVASFVAVASSGVTPTWRDYRRIVESNGSKERSRTPELAALRRVLGARCIEPRTDALRTISALVSFSDDHDVPLPAEVLPRDPARTLMVSIASHAPGALGIDDQLALALALAPDAWTALLACHLATRQLARGRDTRALGTDVPTSVEDRCEAGLAIAAFPPELAAGGDPLGDTYHYWANVCAGVLAASRAVGQAWAIERLFRAGPALMTLVRERTFGSKLFYGNHARVDALALDHGLGLADAYALPRTGARRGLMLLGLGFGIVAR